MALWHGYLYIQAAIELGAICNEMPSSLSPAMLHQLQDEYKQLATDLETLQGHVVKSRSILEEAEDGSVYAQVEHQLSAGQIIEANYQPFIVGKSSVTLIQDRYRALNGLPITYLFGQDQGLSRSRKSLKIMKIPAMTRTRDEMNSKRPINTEASLASPTSISPVVLPVCFIFVVIFLPIAKSVSSASRSLTPQLPQQDHNKQGGNNSGSDVTGESNNGKQF